MLSALGYCERAFCCNSTNITTANSKRERMASQTFCSLLLSPMTANSSTTLSYSCLLKMLAAVQQ